MSNIVLINPHTGLVIHNIRIEYNSNANHIRDFILNKEFEQQCNLERIFVSNGFCRVMEQYESIPIPIRMTTGKSGA